MYFANPNSLQLHRLIFIILLLFSALVTSAQHIRQNDPVDLSYNRLTIDPHETLHPQSTDSQEIGKFITPTKKSDSAPIENLRSLINKLDWIHEEQMGFRVVGPLIIAVDCQLSPMQTKGRRSLGLGFEYKLLF